MTGFTGVNWLPRKAKKLALDLTTGSGVSGVVDSATAWQEITDAFAEVHENSLRIGEQLTEGYRGRNAEDALVKLNPFTDWVAEMAGLTQQVSDTANTYAESYGTAVLDMPHISDLTQLEKAKAEAKSAGGPLLGLSATTEDMEQGLDLQAAKAMETYESASEPAAAPVEFPAAPEIIKYPEEKHEAGGDTAVGAAAAGISSGPRPLSPDSIPGVQTARAGAPSLTVPAGHSVSSGMGGFGGMGAPMAGMLAGAGAAGAAKGIKVGNGGKSDKDEDEDGLTEIGATGVYVGDESRPVQLPDILTAAAKDKVADFDNVDATTLFERGGSKGAVAPPVLGATADL